MERPGQPIRGFLIEFDEVTQFDNKVVFLVRQVATTQHSGVKIETSSARVWWLEDAQIRQAGFYLDRRAGIKAAGFEALPPVHRLTTPRPAGRRACGERP